MEQILKYPRTPHIEGSRLQPGDEDLSQVPIGELAGKHLVIEEKIDGANAALRFDTSGALHLQSRGHYLTGGYRERHFHLFKAWANGCRQTFWEVLGDRYVVYGEWAYAKHTIFYDRLPHYFLEFDVWDREHTVFLGTRARRELLAPLPIVSVPVLSDGTVATAGSLADLIGPSAYQSSTWRDTLGAQCGTLGLDAERALRETDASGKMEGLYIKWEEGGIVRGRYKFVRASFLSTVAASDSHWIDRPIIPNKLKDGVALFAGSHE